MPKHELTELFTTLTAIRADSKRTTKENLLASLGASKKAHHFFTHAVDRRTTLWVTAPALDTLYFKGKNNAAEFDKRFNTFDKLVAELSGRRITGNNAINATINFLVSCNNEAPTFEATWYAGAIDRHLNIGVATESIRKVWPDLVGDFGVQLAESLYDQKTMTIVPEVKAAIKYPSVSEPKLDGMNVSLIGLEKETNAFSRANAVLPALQPWAHAFESVLKDVSAKGIVPREFVLNGEFKADRHQEDPKSWKSSWGKTTALVHAGIKASGFDAATIDAYTQKCLDRDLYFVVYNCYPVQTYSNGYYVGRHFKAGSWDVPYGTVDTKGSRSWICAQFVKAMKKRFPTLRIEVIEQKVCNNFDELCQAHNHWLSFKHEGSMIKTCAAPCELDRGTHFIKFKVYKKIDAVILGVTRGTGKYADSSGALVCYLPVKKDTGKVTCRTEAVRDWAHKNKDLLAGYWVEIVQDGADEDVGKTRNPILARFRNDIAPLSAAEVVKLCDKFGLERPKKRLSVLDFQQTTAAFQL